MQQKHPTLHHLLHIFAATPGLPPSPGCPPPPLRCCSLASQLDPPMLPPLSSQPPSPELPLTAGCPFPSRPGPTAPSR